jgi:hypothetical protein
MRNTIHITTCYTMIQKPLTQEPEIRSEESKIGNEEHER